MIGVAAGLSLVPNSKLNVVDYMYKLHEPSAQRQNKRGTWFNSHPKLKLFSNNKMFKGFNSFI